MDWNNQERRAVPSCEDLQSSGSCVTSDAHWETALSRHLWQDSVGHSTPRSVTGTLERLEQHIDWEPNSNANTCSLPSTKFEPLSMHLVTPVQSESVLRSTPLSIKIKGLCSNSFVQSQGLLEPNNTKTRAGRWTHGREPCNKCASSLEPSTTRSSLLAGLSCGALLDQGSGGVSKICLKQSAQDSATQTSQVASCPNWRQSSRPGESWGRCSEQPPLETQSRLAQCSFKLATCHYTKTYSGNHGRSQS